MEGFKEWLPGWTNKWPTEWCWGNIHGFMEAAVGGKSQNVGCLIFAYHNLKYMKHLKVSFKRYEDCLALFTPTSERAEATPGAWRAWGTAWIMSLHMNALSPKQGDLVHGIHKEQLLAWSIPWAVLRHRPRACYRAHQQWGRRNNSRHCPASTPGLSYSAHTLGHCTWQMGARPWFSALISSHSALPTHKPSRVSFLSVRLENFTHVMCCYLLFQSLVNSPEAKEQLPSYLEQLMEQTKKEISTINNSSANVGAVITILDMVSSIPAEAKEPTIQVRFSFKSYLHLPSPLAPLVTGDNVLPEEVSHLLRIKIRKVLRIWDEVKR